jgi:hypothetical protein
MPTAAPMLVHASNMHSQVLTGAPGRDGLEHRPSVLGFTGVSMSPDKLAVLKSLALRPSASVAPGILPIVAGLRDGGYVADGPSGWMATAKGCEVLARQQAPSAPLPLRNQS